MSVNIAGIVQLVVPAGSTQEIHLEESYGFIAIALLYAAMLISPLYKVFIGLPFKSALFHARRAIGALAFYYAMLHVLLTFFVQLKGFAGIAYYDPTYQLSLLLGLVSLVILTILAATSFDVVVRRMGHPQWKLLHRLVYVAGIAVLIHMVLIGTHFLTVGAIGWIVYAAVTFLVVIESIRIVKVVQTRSTVMEKGKA